MNYSEFENYLVHLSEEDYDNLIQERLKERLNPEQQAIVQAREIVRKKHLELIRKMENTTDPEVQKEALQSIYETQTDSCEHGRSWIKPCLECGQIDHLMFPELFDESGEHLSEDD